MRLPSDRCLCLKNRHFDLKNLENSRLPASNFKSFSRSLEHFFLTVGQNNFGNKIPFALFSLFLLPTFSFFFLWHTPFSVSLQHLLLRLNWIMWLISSWEKLWILLKSLKKLSRSGNSLWQMSLWTSERVLINSAVKPNPIFELAPIEVDPRPNYWANPIRLTQCSGSFRLG